MENKSQMLMLIGIVIVLIAATFISKEEKNIRAIVAVIGAVVSIIGLVLRFKK